MTPEALDALIARGEAAECLELSEIQAVAEELGLDEDDLATLIGEIDSRGIEVSDDCGRQKEGAPYGNGEVAELTTDTLGLFLREIGRYPLLTAEEEVELAQRIEQGDANARERMITSNLRLVVHFARRYQGRGITLLDLIQEGIFGLMRAVERFDWRRGFKFSTYASWWIRQSLQRAVENLSREIRLPVHVGERARTVETVHAELSRDLGRDPTDDELAAASGISPRQLRDVTEAARVVTSIDRTVGEEESAVLGDLLPTEEPGFEAVHISLRDRAVRQAMAALPEPQRMVVRLRYGMVDGGPQPQERVARELRTSTRRVRELERDALALLALRRELEALGEAV